MTKNNGRRDFLKTTAAAVVSVPYFFSQPKTLASEIRSKNDRMPIGVIGAGGMGNRNIGYSQGMVDILAIADVDRSRRESTNRKLCDGKADIYGDYQKILDRDDIKIVLITTPDHWHTKPLIEAMLAGKDVYCEKPMTLTIDEGKLIRKIQKQTGRIVQVGTQQRSTANFTKAIAVVAEGRLGRIKRVTCGVGEGRTSPAIPVAEIPAALDWDRWVGPTPFVDYRALPKGNRKKVPCNCHYEFRWWYEYSGGKLTDMGAHHVDIAQWAILANGQLEGPTSVTGSAKHPVEFKNGYPVQNDRYNVATSFSFMFNFPGGTELVLASDAGDGCLIEGEKGRIYASRGRLTGKPIKDLANNPLPEGAIQKAYKGLPMEESDERRAHWSNFLYCHRERIEPISDVHSHAKMLNLCHLAGISARLGRDLNWDAQNEVITGDDEANSFLARPYRKGYEINM
jgi:predicted dehydrogenase